MEDIYVSPQTNYLTRDGFVMVSNLLIDYQQELGITDLEFNFIVKIMKNKSGFYIHDQNLDPNVSTKTLQRRRASLKEKGYLNFTVIKEQNSQNGRFVTKGISYDLSPLEEKLQMISDRINENKKAKAVKEVKKEELIIEKTEEDSPLEDFKRDYEKCYGVPYILNEFETKRYNNLSDENKKMVSYIFKYCKDKSLLGKIVPRLSLFFKTKFRLIDLQKYCVENGFISDNFEFKTNVEIKEEEKQLEAERQREEENKLIKNIAVNYYYKYYDDINSNKIFYKAVERIAGRRFDPETKDVHPGTDKIVKAAYEANKQYEVNK